jgi:hypothetical protein
MLSRRALVGKLAAGTAAIWGAGMARASSAMLRMDMNTRSGVEPSEEQQRSAAEAARAAEPPPPAQTMAAAEGAPALAAEGAPALATEGAPALEVHHGSPEGVTDAAPPTTVTAPPPWELLRPLAIGSKVAHGWSVAGLTGVVDGVCVLTLRNARGRTHRIHLCRNSGQPQGFVYTKRFDLLVMNGGAGDLPTEEGLAQAVAEIAHVLAANERYRQKATLVAELLPQTERVRRFSGPMDRRLR